MFSFKVKFCFFSDYPWICYILTSHNNDSLCHVTANKQIYLPIHAFILLNNFLFIMLNVLRKNLYVICVGKSTGRQMRVNERDENLPGDALPCRHCNLLYKLHVTSDTRLNTFSSIYQSAVKLWVNFPLTLVLRFITLFQTWHCQSKYDNYPPLPPPSQYSFSRI